MILAIDPGPVKSAYVVLDRELRPVDFGIEENWDVLDMLEWIGDRDYVVTQFVIEMVASYGMAVGKDVFETVFWSGRFYQIAYDIIPRLDCLYRKDVKMNLCQNMRAKDSNIRQALIDRFAQYDIKNGKGTKKNPDWFYGFKADIWAAYAVGVTYADKLVS